MQVYGDAKARVTRVIYTLDKELGLKNSYTLFRRGSEKLDFKETMDEAQNYSLASGIRYFYLNYYFTQEEDGKEQGLQQLKELEFDEDLVEEEKEKQKNKVPKYIEVNLSIWQSDAEEDYEDFKLWFYVNSPVIEKKNVEQKTAK